MRNRTTALSVTLVAGLLAFSSAPVPASEFESESESGSRPESTARWIPGHCLEHREVAEVSDSSRTAPASADDLRWNEAYRDGLAAIGEQRLDVAERSMCRALFAAQSFGPRDWRYAETLDELGLIAFTFGDFETAERVQGAAIAEMLLAVGPHGEPFRERPSSGQAPIRPDCASGLSIYTTRLGWIHERARGRISVAEIETAPWRVFGAGYLPLNEGLARRLDWLLSQYLLEENVAAADFLAELQRDVRDGRR